MERFGKIWKKLQSFFQEGASLESDRQHSKRNVGVEQKKVKDLMVPFSEYAIVHEDATLYEAVVALEEAQAVFDPARHKHRAILICDETNRVVGKIGQIDILKALEPGYEGIFQDDSLVKMGLSPMYQKSLIEQYRLWNKPLADLCRKAAELKVTTFMQIPTEGEYVDENTSLDEAIHQLLMGGHHSLLATQDKKTIVGILRLTDVFMEISDNIKKCEL